MKFLLFSWLLVLSLFSILFNSNGQCLNDQRDLLLQLKQNLSFFDVVNVTVPPRLSTWNSSTDCCTSWTGVTCDGVGHVIGLDLSEELISGGVDDTSSLFDLVYLERLNLSYNIFNSTIPTRFDSLGNLTRLNLSNSWSTGKIPIEISRLTKLVSLDISTLFAGKIPLRLDPDLGTLVKDLSQLRELRLDGVNISANGSEWCQALSSALPKLESLRLSNCYLSGPFDSSFSQLISLIDVRLDHNNIYGEVPDFFANFLNLSLLHLSSCGLNGSFPENILELPSLQTLDLSSNPLHGVLPEFPKYNSLQNLVLSNTNFTGKLPDSIGNLNFLSKLVLVSCSFNGSLPPSMENLTQLISLDLSYNGFKGPIPSLGLSENLTDINLAHNRLSGPIPPSGWEKLVNLESLNLRNNSLNGPIPSTLFTLPSLQKLDLSQNEFSGQLSEFPNWSSSVLDTLDLSTNKLEGPIPLSISNLSSLTIFTLSSNNFNGTLSLDLFKSFRNLSSLDLTGNKLSINTHNINSSMFPQVSTLKLGSCNLRVFPDFLIEQFTLTFLDLSDNQIEGKIPNWIWKIGNGILTYLNLSRNSLEDPEEPFPSGSFTWLAVVDLHSNLLQGKIPILPISATYLDYSNNNFTFTIQANISLYLNFTIFFSLSCNNITGQIPESLCEATYLQVLDLSNNGFSGLIPQCLGRVSNLRVLNLRDNHLDGSMPKTFQEDWKCEKGRVSVI
ncbi:hypothetical protein GIB67_014307 [Kingdonia uniflora]|uniref:Verticillium wilt resistance-like protein n=1 Tax=Kingdonia uniflora TaxID=39325 RepID=A0A7J7NT53_9MAGN|nr:hypothetical protein GIB67_014307 [Kingdonia uniflora]